MIGDRQVVISLGGRDRDHVFDGTSAIAGTVCVVMQIAANVCPGDEFGQGTIARCGNLARAFSHGRWDIGHLEGFVDLLFCLAREDRAVGGLKLVVAGIEQAVLVEEQVPVDRSLTERNVVCLRPGEIERRCTELVGCDHSHIDLQPRSGQK